MQSSEALKRIEEKEERFENVNNQLREIETLFDQERERFRSEVCSVTVGWTEKLNALEAQFQDVRKTMVEYNAEIERLKKILEENDQQKAQLEDDNEVSKF